MAITQGSVGSGGGGGGSVDPTAPNAVELSDGTAYYTAAKDSTVAGLVAQTDFDTKIGALTETAPANDTASSGLNGRLQRVAQRLTSLVGLLPTALTGSGNLKIAVVESTASQAVTASSLPLPTGAAADTTVAGVTTAVNTLTTQSDFDAKIGSLTETVPATDTGSSGLNGRLQRIAQRLTSILAPLADVWNSSMHFLQVGGVSAAGSPPGANPVSIAGWDGTNKQHLLTDSSGRQLVTGAAAAGTAVAGNPVLQGISDGTNVQTVRQVTPNSATFPGSGVGIAAGAIGLYNGGSAWLAINSASNTNTDANALVTSPNAAAYDSNSANWDRRRNNVDVTLLSSAARTTLQSGTITTYNLGAIKFVLDMTVVTAGPSVTLTINEVDPASGKSILLLSGAAVTGVSTNEYTVDPMVPAVANVSAQKRCPRTLNWVITANNANAGTFSLGAMELLA